MNQVVAEHKGRDLHLIVDNFSTHKGGDVSEWLGKHPNVTFHYTPVGSSWMNQIEIWFGILTRQAIRRGTWIIERDFRKMLDCNAKHGHSITRH